MSQNFLDIFPKDVNYYIWTNIKITVFREKQLEMHVLFFKDFFFF